ncbi:DUF2971 domain-containing protein [Sphingomonas sp.]|uniref:DUF2971 domain-containing protein n=1 Tax=Sphingomonas sp. TaxID=28214 RepID=UPI003AFFD90B
MLPPILYKYRSDNELTLKIISDRQIWLATAETLNDPLECQTGQIPDDWKRKIIREQEEARFMGVFFDVNLRPAETILSLDRRETKQWRKAFGKLPHHRKVRKMHQLYDRHGLHLSDMSNIFDKLENQLATVGIFSLSETEEQQLLWSHYADSHKGIVFGFTVEDGAALANPSHLLKVDYKDEKPVFAEGYQGEFRLWQAADGSMRSESRFAFNDPVFRASISTKPCFWSYEQEWRYVHERSGLHPLPGRLASVTFGYRMPADRRVAYALLLKQHGFDVELKEMKRTDDGKWATGSYRS